jgi:hypothetical protein
MRQRALRGKLRACMASIMQNLTGITRIISSICSRIIAFLAILSFQLHIYSGPFSFLFCMTALQHSTTEMLDVCLSLEN